MQVHYVDNSWVRVPVTGVELLAFYNDMLRGQDVPEMAGRVQDEDGYLIEAEEF